MLVIVDVCVGMAERTRPMAAHGQCGWARASLNAGNKEKFNVFLRCSGLQTRPYSQVLQTRKSSGMIRLG